MKAGPRNGNNRAYHARVLRPCRTSDAACRVLASFEIRADILVLVLSSTLRRLYNNRPDSLDRPENGRGRPRFTRELVYLNLGLEEMLLTFASQGCRLAASLGQLSSGRSPTSWGGEPVMPSIV